DLRTGKEQLPLQASTCALEAVGFRPGGKTLMTVGNDLSLREWDAATGRLARSTRPAWRGFQPRFSPGGKYVWVHFAGNDKSSFRLYDPASGKLVLERGGYWPVLSPDDRLLAFMDPQRRVVVLDLATGQPIQTLTPPAGAKSSGWPNPLPRGFAAGGRLILQGDSLSVWDIKTAKQHSWSLV